MMPTMKLSSRVKKPVLHLILSWSPDENPTPQQMITAMDLILKKVGLEDYQAIYVEHTEKHPHLHAAINRVGIDGKAWSMTAARERFQAAAKEISIDMGFREMEAGVDKDGMTSRDDDMTPKQRRIFENSGIPPNGESAARWRKRKEEAQRLSVRIGPDARKVIRNAQSWRDLHAQFFEHGWELREYKNPKNPHRTGLVFVDRATGEQCAASLLGSDYGRSKLVRHLGKFSPATGQDHDTTAHQRNPQSDSKRDATDSISRGNELYASYQRLRKSRIAERATLLERQRENERALREQARVTARGRRATLRSRCDGPLRKVAESLLALEVALERENIQREAVADRQRIRAEARSSSWIEFVTERATLGDEAALAALSKLKRREHIADQAQMHGEYIAPQLRSLDLLDGQVERGDVVYRWRDTNQIAFCDQGSTITFATDRDSTTAALKVAAAKWSGKVRLTGSRETNERVLAIAVDLGIHVSNLELQERQAELMAAKAEKEKPIEDRVAEMGYIAAPLDRGTVTGKVLAVDRKRGIVAIDAGRNAARLLQVGIAKASQVEPGIGTYKFAYTPDGWESTVTDHGMHIGRS